MPEQTPEEITVAIEALSGLASLRDYGHHDDDDYRELSAYLYDHGYERPSELFKFISTTSDAESTSYYGIELEIETRDYDDVASVQKLMAALNNDAPPEYWVAKQDGSLRQGYGFELECLPSSKKAIQRSLKIIESNTDLFRGYYACSAGLHIHVDKPDSLLHIAKILAFMNTNHALALLETIAQRRENQYWNQHVPLDDLPFTAHYLINDYYYRSAFTKYTPCRITESTLEFRMFKSNMRAARINKAIDFCQSVIDFTKDAPLRWFIGGELYTIPVHYLRYVWHNRHHYPDLVKFLVLETKYMQRSIAEHQLMQYTKRLKDNIITEEPVTCA